MFGGDPFANIRRLIKAPVHTMRTFQIDQPLKTHFRAARCAEVECPAWRSGWRMGYDLGDPERAAAARWIRDKSGRSYTYVITGEPPAQKVTFTFPAGQECFTTHRVPLDREPFYVVRGGDFRGNPQRLRQRENADTFIDRWASDLDKLSEVRERG